MDHILWVKLCGQKVCVKLYGSHYVGQIVLVTLCGSHWFGHIMGVKMCWSFYGGHIGLVTLWGSHYGGQSHYGGHLMWSLCLGQFCKLSNPQMLVNCDKYNKAHGCAARKNMIKLIDFD